MNPARLVSRCWAAALVPMAIVAVSAQPTPTQLEVTHVTHSTITVKYYTATIAPMVRVRYGLTTNYEAEGGCVPLIECGLQYSLYYDTNNSAYRFEVRLSGLASGTTYQVCPQVSNDGVTWSTCSGVNIQATTAALPAAHPAPFADPVLPSISALPGISGYTTRTVATDCSDFQNHIDAGASDQWNAGSLIVTPAGGTCDGAFKLKPATAHRKTWASGAAVDTHLSRITTAAAHGFSANDLVMLGYSSWEPIASQAGEAFGRRFRGPLYQGKRAYVKDVVNATTFTLSESPGGAVIPFTTVAFTADPDTDVLTAANGYWIPLTTSSGAAAIQVTSAGTLPGGLSPNTTYYVRDRDEVARTFKLAATYGGSAINITSAGSGGTHWLADPGGAGEIAKWPPPHWIVIRPANFAALPPSGVRTGPEWSVSTGSAKMTRIRRNNADPYNIAHVAIEAQELAGKYWIEGMEITHTDTASAEVSAGITNPKPVDGLVLVPVASGHIVFSQNLFRGLPYPNRIFRVFPEFNGHDSIIQHNYFDGMDMWSAVRETIAPTRLSNTQFRIEAGTYHQGPESYTLDSPLTVNLSGTPSGSTQGLVYHVPASGALVVDLPNGVTADCSPACTVANSNPPAWPVAGNGAATSQPIGYLNFTGSNLSSAGFIDPYGWPFVYRTEGINMLTAQANSRILFHNNYVESTGLPVHFDDSHDNWIHGSDYTITRNHFFVPESKIWSRPASDGFRYGFRQQLEWKDGSDILIEGNTFENTVYEGTPVATAIAIGATHGGAISRVRIRSNRFGPGSGSISLTGGRHIHYGADKRGAPRIFADGVIENNLISMTDQYIWRGNIGANNWGNRPFDVRGPVEDLEVSHNTVYDPRGTGPHFWIFTHPAHGLRLHSNIFWLNHQTLVYGKDECALNVPACTGDGKILSDSMATDFTMSDNSIIAGWTNESGSTPIAAKTFITNAFSGSSPLMADAYLQSEMPTNIAWRNIPAMDFGLNNGVSHKSGGAKRAIDGRDRGVDMNRFERASGRITLSDVLVNPANGTAIVRFLAPDRGSACTVLYGAGDDPGAWSARSAADTMNRYSRSITLSGLSAGEYRLKVGCAGTALSETRAFRL